MKTNHAPMANIRWILGSLLALLLAAMPAAAAPTGPVAEVQNTGSKLVFYPVVDHERIILTVTGPCNYEYRQIIKRGDVGTFRLDRTTIDDVYTYQLLVIPEIAPEIIDVLQQARGKDDYSEVNRLCRDGQLPGAPLTQSEGFRIFRGEIIYDPNSQEDRVAQDDSTAVGLGSPQGTGNPLDIPLKDFVINDDLIVDGSACIGFDCVNGESFGFDTIRLKENNLRIKFDDTSVAASFPRNDWQLTANDSANGGASKFSIDDISGNRTPFTVEANARSHSLYVDDGGRIGSRTSTPSTEIHTIDGDTPTLRLQQDGSSGFAPQTWDVAGNETNFFIRDVTNGSALPFRIRPGAPTSSIFIDVNGDVGLGTASPDAPLEVQRSDGTTEVRVEETNATAADRNLLTLTNKGGTLTQYSNTNVGGFVDGVGAPDWQFGLNAAGQFIFNVAGSGGQDMVLTPGPSGGMTLLGTLTVTGGGGGTVPDYVFGPEYELMSLADLQAFIADNQHLPNVPSAAEIGETGLDMTKMQMRLLEKVEELTLYTLQQQEVVLQQQEAIALLQERLEAMAADAP